jgi:hypothetical protein
MALQSSGNISLGDVNVELGLSRTTQISLGQTSVRDVFMVASGAIRLAADGYGKTRAFVFEPTIAVNTANYNIKAAAVAAGWDQIRPLKATVTVNAGVYVYSTSTGAYAFDTGATFPAETTLALINNGTIIGMGGAGSAGDWNNTDPYPRYYVYGTPAAGGPALIAQYALTVTNNGVIGGGGGGGGSGGAF